jgi:glycosyltransferase involved in cell wall biosynthesis
LNPVLLSLYYQLKPLIPRYVQIALRRQVARRRLAMYRDRWPIDPSAAQKPPGFSGWPEGKKFALVLTHDVETRRGHDRVRRLAELEKERGFRSSFYFVPRRYEVSPDLRRDLVENGFEVGVHGLYHDGRYLQSRDLFKTRAEAINHYLREWGAVGYRSPSMLYNLEWFHDLDIQYDSSTFDTDPLELQSRGVRSIFPFWVDGKTDRPGYLELPYTLPQDFSLFILLGEEGIELWNRKLDWIAEQGGMALLDTHPDYMAFKEGDRRREEYPVRFYLEFLERVRKRYEGQYWLALPKEMANFWKNLPKATKKKRPFPRKLRVGMLSYSFYESDNRVMRYAETLSRRGDEVDVIALKRNGCLEFENLRGVNVYRIQERENEERGKLSYLNRLVRFLAGSSASLNRKHRERPYDLIHVHSVPDFEVFAALIPKLSGTKLILDIHDIVPELYASKFGIDQNHPIFKGLLAVERLSARFSDHVIIANHIWRERLVSRSVPEDKCSVFLNYPDPHLFYPRRRTRQDSRFIIMYPGTLNRHQGLDLAIEAMARIRDRAPQAELHIYGRGSEMPRLEEMVRALGLDNRVFLKAPVPLDRIVEKMAEADLGVVPKRNDPFGGEAFSTKILEFMALGVPVVVAATKIDRYYFNDAVVRFFTPEDVDDLAEALLEMIERKDTRKRLSESALRFVENFSWDKKKDEYLDLVSRLTNHRGF